jgi:hypothetical protein
MLPLYALAVTLGLVAARRWVGQSRRTPVKLAVAALLVIGITSAVGVAEVAASSVYDYHLQSRELERVHSVHSVHSHPSSTQPATLDLASGSTCSALCEAKRATVAVHVRAVKYAAVVLLITNLVLVAFVLAFRGDRLWLRHDRIRGAHRGRHRAAGGVGHLAGTQRSIAS